MKNAICLITIAPNIIWVDFLSEFKNYDIYIVLDNINFNTEIYEVNKKYSNINFIKIQNEDCIDNGYIHSSYMPNSSLKFNEIIAWDRALFYFTNIDISYDKIWFFEDDCFFYNEETILNIDLKHPNSDILCRDKNPEPKDDEWCWFWPAININFPRPYFHSPICGVRLSNKFLFHLNEYTKQNNKLFFIEAMFPSIAHRNNLLYELCDELNQIFWRREWNIEEFNKEKIFHPVKNIEEHHKIRLTI
jgi:hypothetical protein